MSAAFAQPNAKPLPYAPSVENPGPDETRIFEELAETMLSISAKTFEDSGHANRSVHAKSHGLLIGRLDVLDDLLAELAQGLFARAESYPAILRLSTTPGDILPDSVSTPRGLAVKVLGVSGDRMPGSEDEATQDFVMANAPVFSAPDAKQFLKTLKLLAATTDRAETAKKALSAGLRAAERVVVAFSGESATLKTLGGHPETHILGETFYSQAALRFGDHIAKLQIVPVSPELTALAGAALTVNGKPNGLREAVVEFFRDNEAVWELRAQLRTDEERMPVEDASVLWPEELSPYRAVARLIVPAQTAWSEERSRAGDDRLSFSPWHGLAAHRPLGSIMRARRLAYDRSAEFRMDRNGCPMQEPSAGYRLPG
ncbi:catalase family protein [Azospirillum sp. A1-3]|uniref:catalase family protein n=1 Tax=Azospirillum sp. A1-3 TaxID=185874 RepID=UPI0020775327|nr:catalase family protein [Azospirillum sp. A1-3]MCM8732673.1 catalase family protein [Azospirillum sp. A1-3]